MTKLWCSRPKMINNKRAFQGNFATMLSLFLSMIIPFQLIASVGSSYAMSTEWADTLHTIVVDKNGKGNFTSVQAAIDSVPSGNNHWIRIHLNPGTYKEKVQVPVEKQFIFLEGEGRRRTVIKWAEGGHVISCSTFQLYADNFVAKGITIKNTYNLPKMADRKPTTWAPAILIKGDKASFYDCTFTSIQDTISDLQGRHYFQGCEIVGVIDFIWGNGQSIYKKCAINALASHEYPGYVTAQSRRNESDTSGFVFLYCGIKGTGKSYLGRAHGSSSRVIFYKSVMADVIVPEGWSSWQHAGREDMIMYAEVGCSGPGSNMSRRVKWEKRLGPHEVAFFTNIEGFIDHDGWRTKQPLKPMLIN